MPHPGAPGERHRTCQHEESPEASVRRRSHALGGKPGPARGSGDDHSALSHGAAGGRGMRLKVLIVDDEPLAREGLRLMLGGDSQVMEARNGREAVAKIREEKPDLVLLDVQMPRMDGFGVIKAVGADQMPAVIFVTAHDQYAIRAFEISALDYLLKPVTEERFRIAFERARGRLRCEGPDESTRQMLSVLEVI